MRIREAVLVSAKRTRGERRTTNSMSRPSHRHESYRTKTFYLNNCSHKLTLSFLPSSPTLQRSSPPTPGRPTPASTAWSCVMPTRRCSPPPPRSSPRASPASSPPRPQEASRSLFARRAPSSTRRRLSPARAATAAGSGLPCPRRTVPCLLLRRRARPPRRRRRCFWTRCEASPRLCLSAAAAEEQGGTAGAGTILSR